MRSIIKLVRRFVFILMLSLIGLLAINVVLIAAFSYSSVSNRGGWTATEELAEELTETPDGQFVLSKEGEELLRGRRAWAILVADGSGEVVWHSGNLPEEIPLHYSIADISWGTRGYIKDYPTTTASRGNDLLILGHPKDMYWKSLTNTWDYNTVANTPKMLLITLSVNILFVCLIYVIATSGVLRQIRPIVKGIEGLPEGREVFIREKGLLCDLERAINLASEKLKRQERELRKKENARANWISGVSHDIRTPLSMVMGYAGQLEEDPSLSVQNRKKAEIIRLQSVRMKNLVNDLNLSSRLEYNMQPMKLTAVNLISVVRRAAADFINTDLNESYPVCLELPQNPASAAIEGDRELLIRAVANVLTNSQVHNPQGCHISVTVATDETAVRTVIQDDGGGVTEEELERLKNTPHYIMNDGSAREQRHGLGLLIVRQIVAAHGGSVDFGHGSDGGFAVMMEFVKKGKGTGVTPGASGEPDRYFDYNFI